MRLKQQLALEAVLQAGEFTVYCTAELAGDRGGVELEGMHAFPHVDGPWAPIHWWQSLYLRVLELLVPRREVASKACTASTGVRHANGSAT